MASDLELIVKPLRPSGAGWVQWPWIAPPGYEDLRPYAIERWYNRGHEVQVMSSIENVQPEANVEARHEYHLSVSGVKFGANRIYRVSDSRARWAMREFRFDEFFEDNHVPGGLVRNYWRPVADPLVGQVCVCVEREPTMREMQGDYIWRGHRG